MEFPEGKKQYLQHPSALFVEVKKTVDAVRNICGIYKLFKAIVYNTEMVCKLRAIYMTISHIYVKQSWKISPK